MIAAAKVIVSIPAPPLTLSPEASATKESAPAPPVMVSAAAPPVTLAVPYEANVVDKSNAPVAALYIAIFN